MTYILKGFRFYNLYIYSNHYFLIDQGTSFPDLDDANRIKLKLAML